MSSNLAVQRSLNRTQHPVILARRERRQLQAMESNATLELVATQLRQTIAQADILAQTAVTHTAMASAAGTAAVAEMFEKAAPRAAGVLALLEARHGVNLAQRIDHFAGGH
jgi:hypothetical protein